MSNYKIQNKAPKKALKLAGLLALLMFCCSMGACAKNDLNAEQSKVKIKNSISKTNSSSRNKGDNTIANGDYTPGAYYLNNPDSAVKVNSEKNNNQQVQKKNGPKSTLSAEAIKVDRIARGQIGTPYKFGGASPATGFDCSGFVQWVYAQYGYKNVPRYTKHQAAIGQKVSRNSLTAGDIVVFNTEQGMHNGIYLGNGDFIHSPKSGEKVRIESIHNNYWSKNFFTARRWL